MDRVSEWSFAMLRKLLLIGAVLSLTGTTAFAAEYFVAQKPNAKGCEIVSNKPDGKELMQVGHRHRTKLGAEIAMKASEKCR
jgi:hypothetical protein